MLDWLQIIFIQLYQGLQETNDNWSADAYPNNNTNNISDGSRVAPTKTVVIIAIMVFFRQII